MQRKLTLPRLVAALALAGTTACVEPAPTVGDGVRDRGERPEGNEQPSLDGATLRVTGPAGAEPRVGEDGLVRVEVRMANVDALRTVGVDVVVDGADIVEWTREDDFLRSSGGKLVALESKLDGDRLSLVLGTTAPVSSTAADGETLATLVLRPTADDVRVALELDGDMRGLLDASGARLDVTTVNALVAREGE